jgi:hypothetical protein
MSIDQALVEIQESQLQGRVFAIKFITMDGEERHYPKARYGSPDSWQRNPTRLQINERLGTAHRGGRKVSLMRDDGTIPITNFITKEFKTPKWFSIIELNDEVVF